MTDATTTPRRPAERSRPWRLYGLALGGVALLVIASRSPGRPRPSSTHEPVPRSDAATLEIRLSAAQERALGVETVLARRIRGDHPLLTGGRVSLDLERTVRVRPLVRSTIYEVRKRPGDEVKKGDVILVVESTELGDVKNAYLTALAQLELAAESYRREALLRVARATTESDYLNARAAFRTAVVAAEAARGKLLMLGVREDEIAELERDLPLVSELSTDEEPPREIPVEITPVTDEERRADAVEALREIARRRAHHPSRGEGYGRERARTTIRAPIDGTLIARDAARGEFVDPSQVIATVSDESRLWIDFDVYQNDISKVRLGARVDVTTPAYPGTAFVGSVTFIAESVDDATHTLKARVVVDNRRRLLKSGMAAKTVIHCVDDEPELELAPEAVIRDRGETFVIVKRGPGLYQRRRVVLGLETEESVHIEEGLEEGEEVALEGNLFIHSSVPLGD